MIEFDTEQLRDLGERVVDFITRYLAELDAARETGEPVAPPGQSPENLRRLLDEPLPRQPQGVEAAIGDFEAKIAANSARVGHPHFLAWMRTSPLATAIYAEAMAAALNQSVAVWDGAPAATEVELRVIEWLKEMSGFATHAGGLLTSGGSMANFICLLAARSAVDPHAREQGLAGSPPFTLYLTAETHYCVMKAAEMMGIGRRWVRTVPVDERFRMDPDALARQLTQDQEAGLRPLAVVATLGTVNSGACDDLLALGEVCRERGVWLHVDGAYGGLAALVPQTRPLAAGLAQADSLAVDPHKGLYIPFEAGCALVRDPSHLWSAFAVEADYLPNTGLEDTLNPFAWTGSPEGARPFHFRDFGPQLSRSFRALKIYLTLKVHGTDAISGAIARQYELARGLEQRLHAAPDFETLAPVPLGIVAFCYHPPGVDDEGRLDELNRCLAGEVQRRGKVFLSGTRLHRVDGRSPYALRVCFSSFRTEEKDLDVILDEIRAAGEGLC